MCANSENKIKMRTRSSSSSSSPRSVLISKNSNKKSVPNEHQQSSKSNPLAKKARKHKFLSDLRRELSKNDTRDDQRRSNDDDDDDQLLINLFPLHPKRSLVKESDKNKNNHSTKDLQHEEDHSNTVVTYNFFDNTNDCGAASLTGLLWDSIVDKQCSMKQEESFSPQSLTYNFQGEGSDGIDGDSLLLRTALRQKERDIDSSTTEEKWVYYSEVVEKKEEEDMSPSICTPDSGRNHYLSNQISPRLSLKLDYEEIMNAWSDKGSLYIGGDCSSSQIVPDILDDPLTPDSINNVMYGDAAGNMLWKVPEHHLRHDGAQSIDGRREDHSKMMEERGARVLRYKEKRQNRLFSKRIRYEVRKLNAEKRPRMKGRFVKRS